MLHASSAPHIHIQKKNESKKEGKKRKKKGIRWDLGAVFWTLTLEVRSVNSTCHISLAKKLGEALLVGLGSKIAFTRFI